MKYSEFKTEVEKMGLFLDAGKHGIEIVDKYGREYAYLSKESEMIVDTDYENFPKLPQEQRACLLCLLYKIAKTPLVEREGEKRYYLRFANKLITCIDDYYLNLIKRSKGDYYYLDNDREDFGAKTIFTESEISQMDITGFQKIEVEE